MVSVDLRLSESLSSRSYKAGGLGEEGDTIPEGSSGLLVCFGGGGGSIVNKLASAHNRVGSSEINSRRATARPVQVGVEGRVAF